MEGNVFTAACLSMRVGWSSVCPVLVLPREKDTRYFLVTVMEVCIVCLILITVDRKPRCFRSHFSAEKCYSFVCNVTSWSYHVKDP